MADPTRRQVLRQAFSAGLHYFIARGVLRFVKAGNYNLQAAVQEQRPHPVRPPGVQNSTKYGISEGVESVAQLVDAVIENIFGSRNKSSMGDSNQINTQDTNNIPQETINFNPDDRLLNKLEETLQNDIDEASGYDVFDPLPIFVMVGIVACGLIVLAVYCTARYKLLRMCCKPKNNPADRDNGPVDQPATTDSSCSEGDETPKKNGKRPKALQKATIENPYPTLNARLGIKTSNQVRSETIITGSQGMNVNHQVIQSRGIVNPFAGLATKSLISSFVGNQANVKTHAGAEKALSTISGGTGLGISRTRLDSLPSVVGIAPDGGRIKSSGSLQGTQMGRKIPAANGLRRNPAMDSDAKSILSSGSKRSGGSGGSSSGGNSRYHLNTGQPVVDSRMRTKYVNQATTERSSTLLY